LLKTYPFIYMKILKNEFLIIIVYAYNINIVGTPNEFTKAIDCLKKEFEMKDLESIKFCLRFTSAGKANNNSYFEFLASGSHPRHILPR